jgi:hypothetical protein
MTKTRANSISLHKYIYKTKGSGPLYITHHKQVLAVMMTVCYLNEKHKVMFLEHNSLRPYENFNSGNIQIFTVATRMNSFPGGASDYISDKYPNTFRCPECLLNNLSESIPTELDSIQENYQTRF